MAPGTHATVVLDGDGRPWQQGGHRISHDPTPKNLAVLGWLNDIDGTALYLGRPCYFGDRAAAACQPNLWTFARYSRYVIAQMKQAIEQWLIERPQIQSLTLVGHSGGGVLALLLAEELPMAREVILLSTPVDTRLWTRVHGFTPLFGSVNPARATQWRKDVKRLFYFGANDKNVNPQLFSPIAARIPGSDIRVIDHTAHDCCQPRIWRQTR